MSEQKQFDAVVVGAGLAGLYMVYKLQRLGLSVRAFEAGTGIGGTWFWNRYPGARCDIESMQYSYQFSEELQQEWQWTERYASQSEILKYIEHVADRFDLRKDIQLNTRVEKCTFDESAKQWLVETSNNDFISAQFCIMATGCLSVPNDVRIEGKDSFEGQSLYTSHWPQEDVDFKGKKVAIIGTGSSAVQAIPVIAQSADHLYVFQRTPNYVVPAQNAPLQPEEALMIKSEYKAFRQRNSQTIFGLEVNANPKAALECTQEELHQEYEARWQEGGLGFMGSFSDLFFNEKANQTAGEFIRKKVRSIVKDPKTAEALCSNQAFGCKRLCVDNGYFETFNRPNVTLVNIKNSPIQKITHDAVVVTPDETYAVDCIIYATGFDAMTGALLKMNIKGKNGLPLSEKWSEGPKTYLGLSIEGFPNLFTITGPGSPSVLSNMIPSIEQHVNWITNCISYMRSKNLSRIEASSSAERDWVSQVNTIASHTTYLNCNSWYLGANIPGKPRVFMPYIGFDGYAKKCQEIVDANYEGFQFL